jgi:hypothetical protein
MFLSDEQNAYLAVSGRVIVHAERDWLAVHAAMTR